MYGLYGLYGGCTACTGLYGPCTDGQGVRNVRRVREYGLSGTIVRGRPHPVAPCTGCPGQLPWGCPSSRTRRPRTRPVHKGAPKSVYGRVRPYKRRTCTDFHGLRPEWVTRGDFCSWEATLTEFDRLADPNVDDGAMKHSPKAVRAIEGVRRHVGDLLANEPVRVRSRIQTPGPTPLSQVHSSTSARTRGATRLLLWSSWRRRPSER